MSPDSRSDPTAILIGTSIYFVIASCMGLCALAWALWKLRRLVKSGAQLSPFVVFLLLSDLLEVVLGPVFIAVMFNIAWSAEYMDVYVLMDLVFVFIAARSSGMYYHQLVALKGVLNAEPQCHPCSSCVLSYPLATAIAVFLFVFLCVFIPVIAVHLAHISLLYTASAVFVINVVAIVITVILQVINIINAVELRLYSIVVLCLPYVPYIVTAVLFVLLRNRHGINVYDSPVYTWMYAVAACIVSLRLVTEPILCVRVTRAELRTQSPEEQGYSLNVLSVTEAGPAEKCIKY